MELCAVEFGVWKNILVPFQLAVFAAGYMRIFLGLAFGRLSLVG